MSNETTNLTRYGNGIQKQSARPVSVHVDDSGEYWLCDANIETAGNYADAGCLGHSSVPMAEGG